MIDRIKCNLVKYTQIGRCKEVLIVKNSLQSIVSSTEISERVMEAIVSRTKDQR